MVLLKKVVLFLFLAVTSMPGIWCLQEKSKPSESFLEEKQPQRTSRSSLSKARKEAVDLLDCLARGLTKEISASSNFLDAVIVSARDIIEGNAHSASMKLLHKDTVAYIKMLQEEYDALRKRTEDLQHRAMWLKNELTPEKSQVLNK